MSENRPVPVCAVCGQKILGRSVLYHVPDLRFASGKVFKVRVAHPACADREPTPDLRPAA